MWPMDRWRDSFGTTFGEAKLAQAGPPFFDEKIF
jgi:hypothetical protein